MQVLVDGEIQNTVRTRLNLKSGQGEPLERELQKQKNRWEHQTNVLGLVGWSIYEFDVDTLNTVIHLNSHKFCA